MPMPDISESSYELANAAREVARSARNIASRLSEAASDGSESPVTKPMMIWGAVSLSAAALIGILAYRQGPRAIWRAIEEMPETVPARMRQIRRAAEDTVMPKRRPKRRRQARPATRASTRRRGRPRQANGASEAIH